MIRVIGPSVGFIIAMAIWLYALFDLIQTDEVLVRNLPKPMWLLLVIVVPLVGAMAWIIAGRPLYAGMAPGGRGRTPGRAAAPEDRPDWGPRSASLSSSSEDLRRWEDDLARRERELDERRRHGEEPDAAPG